MIAAGDLARVAREVKRVIDRGERAPVLVFEDSTSQVVEIDFRGTPEEVLRRLPVPAESAVAGPVVEEQPKRPGRPKLGVVAREVTLLPRHWEWLNHQPGGASVALRKLVEEARRVNQSKDRVRKVREVAYRFASTMAGNEPGFEEAMRALFAGNRERFEKATDGWPIDVRDHARVLAAESFGGE